MSGKLPLDSNYDLEQQFILRMTDTAAAENLSADIEAGVSFKENFTIEFKPDMRHAIVRYNGQVYQGRLMDLPCIIESLKTTDKKTFYKTADICQMMICTQGEDTGPLRGTAAYLDNRAGSRTNAFDASRDNREFQFLHGVTPPLKNVLRRRFRKSRRKRLIDMPKIEKEVKQLLRADLEAVSVKWEVIWSEPPNTAVSRSHQPDDLNMRKTAGRSVSAMSSTDMTGRATADDELDEEEEDEEATRVYAIDRRDVFGDLSSSSEASSDSSNLSEDEQAELSAKPAANGDSSGSAGNVRPSSPRASAPDQPRPARSTSSVVDSAGLGSLKDELAAELLLSDSGEEGDNANDEDGVEIAVTTTASESPTGVARRPFNFDTSVRADDLEEDVLQASVAAQLVAHAEQELPTTAPDGVDDAELDEVVVGEEVDDDDDDVIHRGGELLDDATLVDLEGISTSRATDGTYVGRVDSDEDS